MAWSDRSTWMRSLQFVKIPPRKLRWATLISELLCGIRLFPQIRSIYASKSSTAPYYCLKSYLSLLNSHEKSTANSVQFLSGCYHLCVACWYFNTIPEQSHIYFVRSKRKCTIFTYIPICSTRTNSEPNQSAFDGRVARSWVCFDGSKHAGKTIPALCSDPEQ